MHEQLDPVGLVHMNGRVYDPELGRFMSPDIVIQDVSNLQSINAYSYVLNNPLSLTDPTGYFFSGLFKAIGNFFRSIFRAIGNVFKAILNSQIGRTLIQLAACAFGPITCVAASAAITLATGGTIGDAVIAFAQTFVSFATWGITGAYLNPIVESLSLGAGIALKGAVHGVVGGALSMAQGGGFADGFAANAVGAGAGLLAGSGPFGQLGSPDGLFARTAIAATAGGLAAEITGGNFSNGALTAGMAHLFNAESSINDRRANHELAVAEERARYEAAGFTTTPNVAFKVDGVRVVLDFIVSTPWFYPLKNPQFGVDVDEYPFGVDAKTGDATLSRNQELVYPKLIAGTIATPVGMRALQAGYIPGVPVYLKMVIKVPRYPGLP